MKAATVNELVETLINLIKEGKGEYEVVCNSEYSILCKDKDYEINDDKKVIDFGGYC